MIVGRGAPFVLRGRPDTFHVFIYAPRQEKIRRLHQAVKCEEEAADKIMNVNRQPVIFVCRYFVMEWPTRELYHMMINSAVGDEVVIDTILSGIHHHAGKELSGSRGGY